MKKEPSIGDELLAVLSQWYNSVIEGVAHFACEKSVSVPHLKSFKK